MDKVNSTFQEISNNLYNQSSQMNETMNDDSEVSDVDFEEVGK